MHKRKPIKAYGVSRSLEALFVKRKPIKEKNQKKIKKKKSCPVPYTLYRTGQDRTGQKFFLNYGLFNRRRI